MAQSENKLKEEIMTELRQEMQGRGRAVQYLNMIMLVAIGLVLGFAIGSRYERKLQGVTARPGMVPRAAAQVPPGAELPPDHPPVDQMGGGSGMNVMEIVQALQGRLEENPEDLEALIQLGNMNFEIQRMDQAIEYYQRALAIDPSNPNVTTDMGIAFRRLGRFDDAIEAFELAASLDATHWQSRLNRGVVLLADKGDLHGAIDAFEEYLALGPDVPNREVIQRQLEQLRKEDATHAHGTAAGTETDG